MLLKCKGLTFGSFKYSSFTHVGDKLLWSLSKFSIIFRIFLSFKNWICCLFGVCADIKLTLLPLPPHLFIIFIIFLAHCIFSPFSPSHHPSPFIGSKSSLHQINCCLAISREHSQLELIRPVSLSAGMLVCLSVNWHAIVIPSLCLMNRLVQSFGLSFARCLTLRRVLILYYLSCQSSN